MPPCARKTRTSAATAPWNSFEIREDYTYCLYLKVVQGKESDFDVAKGGGRRERPPKLSLARVKSMQNVQLINCSTMGNRSEFV